MRHRPFAPEHTSGHSARRLAEIMTDMFGAGRSFLDDTNVFLGLAPRPFGSSMRGGGRGAISRLYGGIHFRAAINAGVQQGRCIAQQVNTLRFRSDEP